MYDLMLRGSSASVSGRILRENAIFGPIPDSLGTLGMLSVIDLAHNRLTGSIPTSLGNLMNVSEM